MNNSDSLEHSGWIPCETETGNGVAEEPAVAGNNTQDHVFLLSMHEVYDLYFPDPDYKARNCYPTDSLLAGLRYESGRRSWFEPEIWWLRTTLEDGDAGVASDSTGSFYEIASDRVTVRPALWVSLESAADSSPGKNTLHEDGK